MEKCILFMFSLVILSLQNSETTPATAGWDTGMENDKGYVMTYLETTAVKLEKSIKGLSKEQLEYKPSKESWSIGQCLEHINATEKMFFGLTRELMEKPENVERKKEIKVTDDELIRWVHNRKDKVKSPEALEPTGKYNTSKKALKEFKAQRADVKNYLASYKGNLRNHITDSPAGAIDAHQSYLFIAGHTERHIAQIEEIKSHPGFPEK